MSATLVSASSVLKKVYSQASVTRMTDALEAQRWANLIWLQLICLEGLTYEHRSRLFGQFRAAERSATRRDQIFDARAWWKAHRP